MTNEDAHRIAALAVASHRTLIEMIAAHGGSDAGWKRSVAAYHAAQQAFGAELRDMVLGGAEDAPAVLLAPDERVDSVLADLRRLYYHIHAGGGVGRLDAERISRGIAALERAQARQQGATGP